MAGTDASETRTTSPDSESILDIIGRAIDPSRNGTGFEVTETRLGRHLTASVSRDNGPPLFVKCKNSRFPTNASPSGSGLDHELAFHRDFLPLSNDVLLSAVPALVGHVSEEGLVFESCSDHSALDTALRDLPNGETAFSELGRIIASLHCSSVERSHRFRANGSPVLTHGHVTPARLVNSPGGYATLLPLIQQAPRLNLQLRRLRDAWRACRPVHGDFKADNILLRDDTKGGAPSIRVVDWECFGIGDPNWDCGSFLGSIYYLWVAETCVAPAEHDDRWIDEVALSRLSNAFLRSYRETIDVRPDEGLILAWAGYWLLHRVLATLPQQRHLGTRDYAAMHLAQHFLSELDRDDVYRSAGPHRTESFQAHA